MEAEICENCNHVKKFGNCSFHGQWSRCQKCGYGLVGQFEVENICEECAEN